MKKLFAYVVLYLLIVNIFLGCSIAFVGYTNEEIKYMENFMLFAIFCFLIFLQVEE